MNCQICDAPLLPALDDLVDALTGEGFAVCKCSGCGVGQTAPLPADLDRYYALYHGNRHGVTAAFCIRRRLRLLRQATSAAAGRRLLDVGCGDGGFLLAAGQLGWETSGTELQPEAARSRGLDVRASVEQFARREAFDCVTFWHSLEHLRDPRAALSCARERLHPRGALLIAVPDNGGWQARLFGRHWLHLDVPRHLFHFDRPSLARLLATTGFRLERQWRQELEYDLLGWSQSALNAVAREPNVFFHILTGKPVRSGVLAQAAHLGLGAFLTAAALPAVAIGSCFWRGGTLIVAARPL